MTNDKFIRPRRPLELRTQVVWTHLPDGAFGEFQINQITVGEIRIYRRNHWFELGHVFVEPSWRRRGIGSLLLLYGMDVTLQFPYHHQSGYPARAGNLLIPFLVYDENPLFFDHYEQMANRPRTRDEILGRIITNLSPGRSGGFQQP